MKLLSTCLVLLVALLHLGFLVLEMFFWDQPLGQKVFNTTIEFAIESAALAMNQGLYNGFLAAGLVWGALSARADVQSFFLGCVIVAGVFGAVTVKPTIFIIQAVPAIVASIALYLSRNRTGS